MVVRHSHFPSLDLEVKTSIPKLIGVMVFPARPSGAICQVPAHTKMRNITVDVVQVFPVRTQVNETSI